MKVVQQLWLAAFWYSLDLLAPVRAVLLKPFSAMPHFRRQVQAPHPTFYLFFLKIIPLPKSSE